MALNKVKIKNTESIRLVTGDKTEISGGSSFNGIEIVGVTNGIADASDVTNKTSLTFHSRVPGISFSVSSTGITAEIEAFPVEDPVEEVLITYITLLLLVDQRMFLRQVLQVNLYSMRIVVKFLYML